VSAVTGRRRKPRQANIIASSTPPSTATSPRVRRRTSGSRPAASACRWTARSTARGRANRAARRC